MTEVVGLVEYVNGRALDRVTSLIDDESNQHSQRLKRDWPELEDRSVAPSDLSVTGQRFGRAHLEKRSKQKARP